MNTKNLQPAEVSGELLTLNFSPLAGSPSTIYCRITGSGLPLVFLHGGWGYDIYSLRPEQMFAGCRIIIPDRSGYGRSTKPAIFGADFHPRAVQETLMVLDALGIERCIFWGHSDGAVISAMIGLSHPERCAGIILEAFHYDARKGADKFFHDMIADPEVFGARTAATLAREHGDPYWRELLRAEGDAWIRIGAKSSDAHPDLYGGRLGELKVPTVVVHGALDPRTEPGELDDVRRVLPQADFHVIGNGGHSPHSESASADEVTGIVREAVKAWKTETPKPNQ